MKAATETTPTRQMTRTTTTSTRHREDGTLRARRRQRKLTSGRQPAGLREREREWGSGDESYYKKKTYLYP